MFGLSRFFGRKKPTVDEMAKALLPLLQAARPSATFTYQSQPALFRSSDGGVINITNLHLEYVRASEAGRADLLKTFAQSIAQQELPARFEEARHCLLPALRTLAALDQARIMAGQADAQALMKGMRPFSEELRVSVVYDTEHAMGQVSAQQMQQWGVSEDEVHRTALDNLRHKAPPAFKQISPGLFCSTYGDYYDAARILLPELAYQFNLPGHPVAMVPNRICLLLASDQDAHAQLAMIERSRDVLMNEPRPLGAEMFRLIDGAWSGWQPVEAAAAKALRELQLRSMLSDYQSQKEALDSMNRRSGRDLFIASYTLVQRENGEFLTYSVLTKGVDTWLPKTDVVMFVDPSKASGIAPKMVEWTVFAAALGSSIESIDCYPPRFHLREQPSDEQVAQLPGAQV